MWKSVGYERVGGLHGEGSAVCGERGAGGFAETLRIN